MNLLKSHQKNTDHLRSEAFNYLPGMVNISKGVALETGEVP